LELQMTDNEESVGPARPMRPWRWDAVAFKAVPPPPHVNRETIELQLKALDKLEIDLAGIYRDYLAPKPACGFFAKAKHWIFG